MSFNENKFRAETIRLAGIAFLTPIGTFFLDPFVLFHRYGLMSLLIFISYSAIFAYIGLIFIARSFDIMSKDRKK